MPKYKLQVDYGKPYEVLTSSLSKLKKELLKLKKKADKGDFPFLDLFISDEKGKDITDEIFKKLKL